MSRALGALSIGSDFSKAVLIYRAGSAPSLVRGRSMLSEKQ